LLNALRPLAHAPGDNSGACITKKLAKLVGFVEDGAESGGNGDAGPVHRGVIAHLVDKLHAPHDSPPEDPAGQGISEKSAVSGVANGPQLLGSGLKRPNFHGQGIGGETTEEGGRWLVLFVELRLPVVLPNGLLPGKRELVDGVGLGLAGDSTGGSAGYPTPDQAACEA
jgi:hypothetical protein